MTDRDISSLDEDTQNYIRSLREEAKTNRLKASEAEAKVTERDTAVQAASAKIDELTAKVTESSGLQDQYAQALSARAEAELKLTRTTAAIEAGLPHTFAERLQGDSADALKADAEAFKAALGTTPTKTKGEVAFDRTHGNGPGAPAELDPIRSAIQAHLLQTENQE